MDVAEKSETEGAACVIGSEVKETSCTCGDSDCAKCGKEEGHTCVGADCDNCDK